MTVNSKGDHTSIPIEFDPQRQRMSGYARHGMTPFDVPFISHIHKYLWQGGCQDGLILPEFIDVVVSLYPWERYVINHAAERIEIEMHDDINQSLKQVDELARLVNEHRNRGKNVLVHCQAGLNRSSLIVARALMLSEEYTGTQAIALLREKRSPACLCNTTFERYLIAIPNTKE